METFELWEGVEDGKLVRRLIRPNAILEGDNPEANARAFFKLEVRNLRQIGEARLSVKEGISETESLGLCWVRQDYPCRRES